MNSVTSIDILGKKGNRVSGFLHREQDISARKEGIRFVIGQTITDITGREMERRTFDYFPPIKTLFGFEDKFTRTVASIEAAGHDGSEEEIVIGLGTMCLFQEGRKVIEANWLLAMNWVSTDLFGATDGGLHQWTGTAVIK